MGSRKRASQGHGACRSSVASCHAAARAYGRTQPANLRRPELLHICHLLNAQLQLQCAVVQLQGEGKGQGRDMHVGPGKLRLRPLCACPEDHSSCSFRCCRQPGSSNQLLRSYSRAEMVQGAPPVRPALGSAECCAALWQPPAASPSPLECAASVREHTARGLTCACPGFNKGQAMPGSVLCRRSPGTTPEWVPTQQTPVAAAGRMPGASLAGRANTDAQGAASRDTKVQ